MDRRTALLRALPILLLTLLFSALIVFLALRTAGSVRRSEDVVAAYLPVIPACDGEPVASAPRYDPAHPTPSVAVLRRAGASWAPDPSVLPAAWQPEAPENAELVLCLEAALPLTAPSCADEQEEARTYGYATRMRLVAGATAEEVAGAVLNSAPYPGCLWAEAEPVALSNEQIREWLAPLVRPETGE